MLFDLFLKTPHNDWSAKEHQIRYNYDMFNRNPFIYWFLASKPQKSF